MISILAPVLLLALLGVSSPRHVSFYDDDAVPDPMVTSRQERRICAELCMSGMGGEPCGDSCWHVTPQGLPGPGALPNHQSLHGHAANLTRRDVCPVLCANRLGVPLCGCDTSTWNQPFYRVNYVQICAAYCRSYNYQLLGCLSCRSYDHSVIEGVSGTDTYGSWNEWCVQMCKDGDGGSACYCDLLPMGLQGSFHQENMDSKSLDVRKPK